MFIHLRNHSHYSLLRALPKINALIKKTKDAKMPAVAITDYSNMYGTIEFYSACKKAEIKPIIGVEFSIHANDRLFQIVVIAKNNEGYKNLMRITSIVNTDNPSTPTLTDEILIKYKEGLIVLSGGLWGDISNLLLTNETWAEKRLIFYKENFGEDFYLELNPQISSVENGKTVRERTIQLAKKTSTPLVATFNTHYLNDADKNAHKTLCLIHGNENELEEYNHLFQKDSFAFIDDEEKIKTIFSDVPEAIENTFKIVESCTLEIPL
jgi:DNA polymerase-3 subunit alpha